jgi:hypothetical protein
MIAHRQYACAIIISGDFMPPHLSIFLNREDNEIANNNHKFDYILIKVTLPICLHLDNRPFYISFKEGRKIEIRTENIFYEKETYIGSGKNIEVLSDEFSHFRFTRVYIKIPLIDDGPIDNNKLLETYSDTFFKAINTFIDSVRIALKRYGLKNYHDFNGFLEPIDITIDRTGLSMFHIGHHITMAIPLRSDKLHIRIQEVMNNVVSLYEAFLSDAKRDYYYHNYTHSIINAVISLEIILSEFIRKSAIKKGIDGSAINNYINSVGLTGNLKTTLKILVPEEVPLPNEDIFHNCKSAITIRNAIVHKGRRDVLKSDANGIINDIETMIIFIRTLLKDL